MNYFNIGDVVMVVGKIDTKVREKNRAEIVAGTVEQFLVDQQVSVLLENGDVWVGSLRDIVLLKDQLQQGE
jgi:hypothetical protein